jgi:hypothetical protein
MDCDFLSGYHRNPRIPSHPEDVAVNTSQLKAREVEALTFIYSANEPATADQRNRSPRFFDRVWGMLRRRPNVRPLPVTSGSELSDR